MANTEIIIPKLGESVIEATLTKWIKNEGDPVTEEEPLAEIATDKVDSEIPSPVSGILVKKLYPEGTMIPVGTVFAIIQTETVETVSLPSSAKEVPKPTQPLRTVPAEPETHVDTNPELPGSSTARFYSPLVKNIARQEGISFAELDQIPGSGSNDRITKQDLLAYLKKKKSQSIPSRDDEPILPQPAVPPIAPGADRIIEMNRIRQLIAGHMVRSVQTSPHVTSFMEADMTRIVRWLDKNKEEFKKRENQKLTYTPVFIEAIAKSIKDFPMINVSVEGNKILVHKNINVGMAVALPDFNLIVPVVKNADEKNLTGLVKSVNDLAGRARTGKLLPDEITGGTLSLTNLGSFGTLAGTPIINQPQTAIVAVGAIKKRAVVIESEAGDVIAIRSMMILSVTYDHRVIDGALGGQFLTRIVHYLENFNSDQTI